MSYLTDAAMTISENLAALLPEGKVMTRRFTELAGWIETDDRTGDEIAADIIKRAGLRVKK